MLRQVIKATFKRGLATILGTAAILVGFALFITSFIKVRDVLGHMMGDAIFAAWFMAVALLSLTYLLIWGYVLGNIIINTVVPSKGKGKGKGNGGKS
jgi:hypothetical protein